jgi:hypothetical protein
VQVGLLLTNHHQQQQQQQGYASGVLTAMGLYNCMLLSDEVRLSQPWLPVREVWRQ